MATLTEENILDIVYALKEGDDDGWDTDSAEYLVGRKYCNAAITRWEFYDNVKWRELWTTLTAASDGDKTTDGTSQLDCPTNFLSPSSWVRVGGEFWQVVSPSRIAELADSTSKFCYFTGSKKDGFKLNFNPKITMTTGDTVEYEYYKTASTFTTTTSTTEMSNPYFIVSSVLAHFIKLDGEDNIQELQQSDEFLEQMKTDNESGLYGVPDLLNETITNNSGFGE
jgi:hypothetical protein